MYTLLFLTSSLAVVDIGRLLPAEAQIASQETPDDVLYTDSDDLGGYGPPRTSPCAFNKPCCPCGTAGCPRCLEDDLEDSLELDAPEPALEGVGDRNHRGNGPFGRPTCPCGSFGCPRCLEEDEPALGGVGDRNHRGNGPFGRPTCPCGSFGCPRCLEDGNAIKEGLKFLTF